MHINTASTSRASAPAPLSVSGQHPIPPRPLVRSHQPQTPKFYPPSRNNVLEQIKTSKVLQTGIAAAAALLVAVSGADARLEGVNKPELLPKEYTPVIDVAGFLTDGEVRREGVHQHKWLHIPLDLQERRIRKEVESLERDTGVKLRVLAQNYPDTPGLAIKDFWGVDADTVVFVADPSIGNIININVGENIDLLVPRVC